MTCAKSAAPDYQSASEMRASAMKSGPAADPIDAQSSVSLTYVRPDSSNCHVGPGVTSCVALSDARARKAFPAVLVTNA
jgi:hypothetical protein